MAERNFKAPFTGNYTYYRHESPFVVEDGDEMLNIMKQERWLKPFDKQKFSKLIRNEQYEDAADYAETYYFDDPKLQERLDNAITNLRSKGRQVSAIYSRLNPEDRAKVKFANNVFTDGGIDILLNSNDSSVRDYANGFVELKRKIGSKLENDLLNGKIEKEATQLNIRFAPEKQSLLGADWLAPDNPVNIDNFYKMSGLTKQDLINAGVTVTNDNGDTYLQFSKSNPLANKILYYVSDVDAYYNGMGGFFGIVMPVIKGLDNQGNLVAEHVSLPNNLNAANYINKAIDAKKGAYKRLDTNPEIYSSTIGPAISDELSSLQAAYRRGELTSSEFEREYKRVAGWMDDIISGLGVQNSQMYSNAYNDNASDMTLVEMDNTQREELMNLINAKKDRMHLLSMISNGKIGTAIVIDPATTEKKDEEDDVESTYKTRRRIIFIPGLFEKQAQEKINRNTNLRAINETNNMIAWGYDYKTVGGDKIKAQNGTFTINGNTVNKETAIAQINKDMIKQEVSKGLKNKFKNSYGQIIDFDAFEQQARIAAIQAANEIMPNVPLTDLNGNPYTIDDIFGYRAFPNDDALLNNSAMTDLQYLQYDKLKEIMDVYNYIMKGTSNYR